MYIKNRMGLSILGGGANRKGQDERRNASLPTQLSAISLSKNINPGTVYEWFL